MRTAEEIYDLVAFLRRHKDYDAARKEGVIQIELYRKEQIFEAICDYITDKSDKAHINTIEDWVDDWITSNN